MIYKIDRRTFNDSLGDSDRRKALAFAVYVKNAKPASVIPNWSYRQLSRITGLSVATCQKRIAMLRKMHLVRIEPDRIVFKKLRRSKILNKAGKGIYHTPKNRDIDIRKFTNAKSVKDIEKGIEAMLIVEVLIRKDFVKQLIRSKQHPKDTKEYKRALRICRERGYSKYCNGGISYKYIAQKLHCGYSKVNQVIKYGKREKLYWMRHFKIKPVFVGFGKGKEMHEGISWSLGYSYSHVYQQPCNTFFLYKG